MLIAIDMRGALNSGIGTYIRGVIPRIILKRQDWRFILLGAPASLMSEAWADAPNVEHRPLRSPIYGLNEQIELFFKAPQQVDLFWTPHYNLPLFGSKKRLVNSHDVNHLALPQYVRGLHRRLYAHFMLRWVRWNADGIIYLSEFGRQEFQRYVGRLRQPSLVAHLAAEESWQEEPGPRLWTRPYVLAVGSIKPHKNLPRLIRAFASIQDQIDADLVIVGGAAGLMNPDDGVDHAASKLGGRIFFPGRVDDVALRAWVAHAVALAQPSLYEGFGLPPLEAMAAGTATIVSSAASLPEVCGDASLYFDPEDEDDIARAIVRIVQDDALRAELKARGRVRAAQFSWDACATATEAFIESVVKR
jgi:glycosyltransferase involved in cell wall biosynthesis